MALGPMKIKEAKLECIYSSVTTEVVKSEAYEIAPGWLQRAELVDQQ